MQESARRRARSSTAWAAVVVSFVLGSAAAQAQHGTTGYGAMPMGPHGSVLVDTQNAEFELPGRSGVWQTLGVRAEYPFAKRFSLAARGALAHVEYDSGASALGPTDSELAAAARVLDVPRSHTSLALGLSGELPTGDADEGTGNGHVSLFPFAAFHAVPSRWLMLHAMAGDRVVLGEHGGEDHADHHAHAEPHGSVIMPHGEHELIAHGGACFMLVPVVISPSLEFVQVFAPESDTQLTAQLELGLAPRRGLKLALGFDVPLTSDPRFEWRSRLMAAWLY